MSLKKAGVYKPKKEIAKIDKKPTNRGKDLRCKLDKELEPKQWSRINNWSGVTHANAKQRETQRSLQQLIKFNHSILEYMKKDQEIEENYALLEAHDSIPFDLSTEECLTPETDEQDEDLEPTQVIDDADQ